MNLTDDDTPVQKTEPMNYPRPLRDIAGGYRCGDGSYLSLTEAAASRDQWASANATMRLRMLAEHNVDVRHGREVSP